MTELSEFERAYFIQTRAEIDSDKRERDLLINISILIVGGGTVIALGSGDPTDALRNAATLALAIPALALVTALMWIRREKLRQIADRWQVLHAMLSRHLDQDWMAASLESRVLAGLTTLRYINKDLVLKFSLSGPLYGVLVAQASFALADSRAVWRLPLVVTVIVTDVWLACHFLWRPILDRD